MKLVEYIVVAPYRTKGGSLNTTGMSIAEEVNTKAAEGGWADDKDKVVEALKKGLKRGDLSLYGLKVKRAVTLIEDEEIE